MTEPRLEVERDGYQFIWTRCCCGVKAYASKDTVPDLPRFIGEYQFQESFENTVAVSEAAALEEAKRIIP